MTFNQISCKSQIFNFFYLFFSFFVGSSASAWSSSAAAVSDPDQQNFVPFDIPSLPGLHENAEREVKVTPTRSLEPHEYYD